VASAITNAIKKQTRRDRRILNFMKPPTTQRIKLEGRIVIVAGAFPKIRQAAVEI